MPQFQAEMAEYGDFHFMQMPQLDDSLHFYDINHLNQDGVDIFCRAFCDSVIQQPGVTGGMGEDGFCGANGFNGANGGGREGR